MKECRICKNTKDNQIYYIKERQLNKGDMFAYLYCGKCGTLQLNEEVENISCFYQNEYYAFVENDYSGKTKAERLFDKWLVFLLVNIRLPDKMYEMLQGHKYYWLKCLYGTKLKYSDSLLDIGCGSGNWLQFLYTLGFRNLTGVDLYAPPYKDRKWNFIRGGLKTWMEAGSINSLL